jgi:Zn-dependent peptidase ImmA (M78 family)
MMKKTLVDLEFSASLAAEKLIDFYGIRSASDIRLEEIAMDRGVFVHRGSLSGMDGFLLRKGNRGFIRVRDSIPTLGQRRFVIGHELGHWELHADVSQAWLCSSQDIHDYGASAVELEANAFSSSLLMPSALFQPRCNQALSFQLIKGLAEEFRTSLMASAIRFVQFSKEDCYVVFSQDDKVKWFRRSPRGSEQFISPGSGLSDESLAYLVEYDEEPMPELTEVPLGAWFPKLANVHGMELYEQSVMLTEGGLVMSLLVLI